MKYYKLFLCVLIIGIVLYAFPRILAHAEVPPPAWVPAPMSLRGLISHYSEVYGIASSTLYATLKCESKLNPAAVGDYGTSFGIAQIHLPAHPSITKAEALNADFSIHWAAKQFSLGHQGMWTCARVLGFVN